MRADDAVMPQGKRPTQLAPQAKPAPVERAAMAGRSPAIAALVTVAALLVLHGAVSWLAVRGKSATSDETLHPMAGYMHLRHGDHRIDREDPPLWKYWAALPLASHGVRVDTGGPLWRGMTKH